MSTRLLLLTILISILSNWGCRTPAPNDNPYNDTVGFEPDTARDTSQDTAPINLLCPEGTPDLFVNTESPYFGGTEEVRLEIIDISNLRCGACASFAKVAHELWQEREDYQKYVRVYFHHFPFDRTEDWDTHAASVAAFNQGSQHFWTLHDHLYEGVENNDYLSPSQIADYAEETLGLDMTQYNVDVVSDETRGLLQWDKAQAETQGVTGTPSVFICGEKIPIGDALSKTGLAARIDEYLL